MSGQVDNSVKVSCVSSQYLWINSKNIDRLNYVKRIVIGFREIQVCPIEIHKKVLVENIRIIADFTLCGFNNVTK